MAGMPAIVSFALLGVYLLNVTGYIFIARSLLFEKNAKGISRNALELALATMVATEVQEETLFKHIHLRLGSSLYFLTFRFVVLYIVALSVVAMYPVSRHAATSTYKKEHDMPYHWATLLPCLLITSLYWLSMPSDAKDKAFAAGIRYMYVAALTPQVWMYRKHQPSDGDNFVGEYFIFQHAVCSLIFFVEGIYYLYAFSGNFHTPGFIPSSLATTLLCFGSILWPSDLPSPTQPFVFRMWMVVRTGSSWKVALLLAVLYGMFLRAHSAVGPFETVLVVGTSALSLLVSVLLAVDHFIYNGSFLLVPVLGWKGVDEQAADGQRVYRHPIAGAQPMDEPLIVDADEDGPVVAAGAAGTGARPSNGMEQYLPVESHDENDRDAI